MTWITTLRELGSYDDCKADLQRLRQSYADQLAVAPSWEASLRLQGAIQAIDHLILYITAEERDARDTAERQSLTESGH